MKNETVWKLKILEENLSMSNYENNNMINMLWMIVKINMIIIVILIAIVIMMIIIMGVIWG